MEVKAPIPPNELKRIINLADFDLDYAEIQESLGELTQLAAKIAGTNISMINLIDSLTSKYVPKCKHPREILEAFISDNPRFLYIMVFLD